MSNSNSNNIFGSNCCQVVFEQFAFVMRHVIAIPIEMENMVEVPNTYY